MTGDIIDVCLPTETCEFVCFLQRLARSFSELDVLRSEQNFYGGDRLTECRSHYGNMRLEQLKQLDRKQLSLEELNQYWQETLCNQLFKKVG